MPRVNGIMQPLPNVYGTPGRPIESAKYNTQLDDLISEANGARPLTAGGTGASNLIDARKNLGVQEKSEVVQRSGDTMTGALSTTPGAAIVMNGGATVITYSTGNRRRLELRSNANTLDIQGLPESGGDLELDMLYTAGSFTFAQTIRWKLGAGAENTNLASTGVVLTAGVRYTIVLWNMGGVIYGAIA